MQFGVDGARRRRSALLGLWLWAAAGGCGLEHAPLQDRYGLDGDAGSGGAAAPPALGCADDQACSDGVFCNGRERCLRAHSAAEPRRCVGAFGPPCAQGWVCDEASERCLDACEGDLDRDGDGHGPPGCGGADCDDADPARNPGASETCDELDNDCDGLTDEALDCGACGRAGCSDADAG